VGLLSFDPEEKDIFESQYFRGMYYQKPIASLVSGVFRSFTFFARFEHKNRLSSGFAPYSKLLSESFETFFELGFLHDRSKGCFCFG
jgi:hypothetical protein